MKKLILILLIIIFPFITFSQQVTITVLERDSREPVSSAFVRIPGLENQITDDQGKASVYLTENTRVTISHISFEEQSVGLQPGVDKEILITRRIAALGEVVVSAFESDRPLLQQAAAISRVSERELYRFNETSIVQAFNTKPGIRVEERAPASYRISIRGSSLRAPFGVRNIKVYWNDIPFTTPDGTTQLNLLDLSNIQNTEIIKGPAGSIYGAGNGGVITMQSRQEVTENRVSSDLAAGDFGMFRYRIGVDQQLENGGISASFVDQRFEGYREHSAVDRKVFQLAGHYFPSTKQRLSTQLLISDLNYQIPGALTEEQFLANPRQARPGSEEQNSSIAQKSIFAGISHQYQISDKVENVTTVYMENTEFENPFILDYKRELNFSYGGRTKFVRDDNWAGIPVRVILGGEYQYGRSSAQNFGNRAGVADTIRFNDDLITTQAFLFQQLEMEFTPSTIFTVALSENFSRFDINRSIDAQRGIPSAAERIFPPVVLPRIALSQKLNATSAVHGSISTGFSPPTIDEVRTNEGSINLDLEAERGINYEVGYRAGYMGGRINIDASAFYFRLEETITTFTNEQGVVLFRNAGSTDQRGLELQLDYTPIRNQHGFVNELKIVHAFTGHYFEFRNYERAGNDFSGNQLTGVAPNSLVNQLDMTTRWGLYLNFTHQFVDEIPLNDANTVFQDSYNLVSARMGWRRTFAGQWDVELYGGAENLLDETYSLGNDLNAFANRYYQPAPARNWFGGLKLGFRY